MKAWTCQVFTARELVTKMLGKLEYKRKLYGKKILENSCGDGAFLKEIVRRYILDSRRENIADADICRGLERDIYGFERDEHYYHICLEALDAVADRYGLREIHWNIHKEDALSHVVPETFDFVVGNPPYITYYNLPVEDRRLIKESFETCKAGKPDYYYAFTEAAIQSLKPGGKLAYLIPNNFMKNRFSGQLRQYLLPHIVELTDYRDQKVFKDYLTSSAILVCEKDSNRHDFSYVDIPARRKVRILKSELAGKWAFYLPKTRDRDTKRFGDCFRIAAPIATLLNKAFVLEDVKMESDKYVLYRNKYIEKGILRKAASPRTLQKAGTTYIIFPYIYQNEKPVCMEEGYFKRKYPLAYTYLEQFREQLNQRKCDKGCAWFEYGRSQAITHIDQEKIILSTLITDRVRYYQKDAETVPFSGMFLVPREGYSLSQAKDILNSVAFFDYVKEIGISVSGSSYRISPKDVQDFRVEFF